LKSVTLNLNQSTFTKGRREIAMAVLKVEAQALGMAMPLRPLEVAGVVEEDFQLPGIITDGDLRRALLTHADIRRLQAADCMTRQPTTRTPEASLRKATRWGEIAPGKSPPSPEWTRRAVVACTWSGYMVSINWN
jgi:hypothetical protein